MSIMVFLLYKHKNMTLLVNFYQSWSWYSSCFPVLQIGGSQRFHLHNDSALRQFCQMTEK